MKAAKLARLLTIAVIVVAAQTVPAITWSGQSVSAAPGVGNNDPGKWGCAGVDYAQVLGSDRLDGLPIRPTSDSRGKWIPVVMVHGWTASSTHGQDDNGDGREDGTFSQKIDLTPSLAGEVDAQRSMIGQIQTLPGSAVFTFDYFDYSGRWVDDSHIGPALGDAIDCLFDASGGEKVIVVAHSMGGLATRYALGQNSSRADKVSTVITVGTPNTGSLAARLVAGAGAAVGNILPPAVSTVLRALQSACSAASAISMTHAGLCAKPLSAFDGAAGRALRTGSPELQKLASFPDSVNVHALVGDATVKVATLGFFGIRFGETDAPMGDFIVGTDSATAGSDTDKRAHCEYRFDVVQSPGHDLVVKVRILTGQEAPADIPTVLAGACYHNNLTRAIVLTNEATALINDDLTSRAEGDWTDPVVVVTAHSVGAAQLGMSGDEIEAAANVDIRRDCTQCDGDFYADLSPADQYPIYYTSEMNPSQNSHYLRVSLRTEQARSGQVVTTDEGFSLGDPVEELHRIYGNRLKPYEILGMYSIEGYSLAGRGGYIIFNTAETDGMFVHEIWVTQRLR